MAQHDNRNRQRGGSQQEGYSQHNRQQGWHESSRQPQGDFGRGRDHAPLGSSDDWNRQQDHYGAYRDADRYGEYDRGAPERSVRPSGLDREYRGAGYAGPGGYGGGFGSDEVGQERDQFDPDYSQWRREQMRALDDDYNQWRQDRFKKFSEEFSTWRSNRSQQADAGKKDTGSTSGKQNKDGN
jgi:hypothetical protein